MKAIYFLGMAGALALAGCGGTADENRTPEADATTDMTAAEATPELPIEAVTPGTPKEFVNTVAASDMFEIESAKVAQTKATAQEVKDFAATMVKDHTASTNSLKDAAGKAEPAVTAAAALTADQQQQLDALKAATAATFDATYKQQQIAAHEKALAMLRGYANSTGPQSLKDFATKTATVVEGHLASARALPAS